MDDESKEQLLSLALVCAVNLADPSHPGAPGAALIP